MPSLLQIKQLEAITNPLIRQRYLKYFRLPLDLRQTLFAVETADKIWQISQRYRLNNKQLGCLAYTIGMILLAETPIRDFIKTLQEKCRLNQESAHQLGQEVNQEIFLPYKESLKKIHQISEWPEERKTTPTISTAPATPSSSPPSSSPPHGPETKPEPRLNGNIVDLKNHQ